MGNGSPRYAVRFSDETGRMVVALVDDPIDFVADRVAQKKMGIKEAKTVQVFAVQAADLDVGGLEAAAKRMVQLYLVKDGGEAFLNEMVHKRRMTRGEADELEEAVLARWPLWAWGELGEDEVNTAAEYGG